MKEPLIYKGFWFLPENPKNYLSGILTYNPNFGIELDLINTFIDLSKLEDIHKPDFILGVTTDNQRITLYKSFARSWNILSNVPCVTYTTDYTFIGDRHFSNQSELKFDSISAKFKNFDEWVNVFGFGINHNFQAESKTISINYELPKPLTFKINDEISGGITFSVNSSLMQNVVTPQIKQSTSVYLEYSCKQSFDLILDDMIFFQNFFSLGCYELAYPLHIILYSKDNESKKFQLIYKPSINYVEERRKRPWEFLFNLDDIQLNFESILQKWYAKKETMQHILTLLLESFYHERKLEVNVFINISQAIEAFHRHYRKNESLDPKDFKSKKEAIIATVPEIYKDEIREMLHFSNEPKYKQRLEEVIAEVTNKILDHTFLKDKDQFIKNVKDNRNYYTHYDKSLSKKAFKAVDLYEISKKLRMVLIFLILSETGFTNDQIADLYKRAKANLDIN